MMSALDGTAKPPMHTCHFQGHAARQSVVGTRSTESAVPTQCSFSQNHPAQQASHQVSDMAEARLIALTIGSLLTCQDPV